MKTAIAANVVITLLAFSTLSMSRGDDFSPPARSAAPAAATKLEGTYEGAWATTKNKKLDGTASCQVKQLSSGRWQGRFWGQWQQMPFDYAVEFRAGEKQTRLVSEANPGKNGAISVNGKATIDGAQYEFVGELSARAFTIQFTGDRYEGAVLLKRVQEKKPVPSGSN